MNDTFENYILSDSNKKVYEISKDIIKQPGLYSPLFIYGPKGSGKTYLLHTIENSINKDVLYIKFENLIDDYLNSLNSTNHMNKYIEKYKRIDVLLIDNIENIKNMSTICRELINIIDNLKILNKQVIITSSLSVNELMEENKILGEYLKNVMTEKILVPDNELKLKLIDKTLKKYDYSIENFSTGKDYIASKCESNLKKIESSIERIFSYANFMGYDKITFSVIVEALKDFNWN